MMQSCNSMEKQRSQYENQNEHNCTRLNNTIYSTLKLETIFSLFDITRIIIVKLLYVGFDLLTSIKLSGINSYIFWLH